MKLIIDRFEEDTAVLETEDGEMITAPRALFSEFSEGEHIRIEEDPIVPTKGPDEDSPHALFEKLRRKSKKNRRKRD